MNSSSRSKGSPLSSPTVLDKDNDSVKETSEDTPVGVRHARPRRSADARPADRLSIFGATLGTLGKSRKPPPRFV